MNARWISRMCAYKNTPFAFASAKAIIMHKISRQHALLKTFHLYMDLPKDIGEQNMDTLFLCEARMAKYYWSLYRSLFPQHTVFYGRKPRSHDPVNRLLDIGYHTLRNALKNIFDRYHIEADLGLMHHARKTTSTPLIYDHMELFRSDIVDYAVLRFFRLKKRPVEKLLPRDIAFFVHTIKHRFEKKYYLKNMQRCYPYQYYMELQVLRFVEAVNHAKVFIPFLLPDRHESRCLTSP